MSTEIIQIQGECQVDTDAAKREVSTEPSDLYVKTFYGGAQRSKMVKFHIHQSDGADAEINLTLDQVNALIEAIQSECELDLS